MIDFTPPVEDDRKNNKLVYFVNFTFEILMMTAGEDFPHQRRIIVKALLLPMRQALLEVKPQVAILVEKIQEVPIQKLIEHGLHGKQLDFKFAVVKRHFRRFVRTGGARLLKNLLNVLDTTLDSIIEVAGVGGALKEIKEAIAESTLEE